MRTRFAGALAVLAFALSCPALADDDGDSDGPPGTVVTFTGEGSDSVADTLAEVSELAKRAKEPTPAIPVLQTRAAVDRDRLAEALAGLGYYDGTVEVALDVARSPPVATITVLPRTRYVFAGYAAVEPGGKPARLAVDRGVLGAAEGKPATGGAIVSAESKLVSAYTALGYPFAKATERAVVVDHQTHTVSVTETVAPGPIVHIGQVTVAGLETVDADFVQRHVGLKRGDLLTSAAIDDSRASLRGLNLFDTVRIAYPTEVAADGTVPVTVTLSERAPRSIGGGVSYNNNTGIAVTGFWEHRNLFGAGEKLRTELKLGNEDRSLDTNFRKPDFLDENQALLAEARLRDENTDAYDERSALFSVGLERPLFDQVRGTLGIAFEQARITDETVRSNYTLVSFPGALRLDTRDQLLDPKDGVQLELDLTPFVPVAGQRSAPFVQLRLRGSLYQAFDDKGDVVGAAFADIGTTLGAALLDIPKIHRFFAGGGGSIRGYGYQKAGALDVYGKPVGGRSLAVAGTELRLKVTDTIGIVPFVEAGGAYDKLLPQVGRQLFVGAGIGVRYYTPIGPIRLDLATPLNKRREDGPVQVYISLGQAF